MPVGMKYAISSHHATTYSAACFGYVSLRSGFESLTAKISLLRKAERRFNNFFLRWARTALNSRLVAPHLFDAVELHLTDPRLFYNSLEWRINDKTIGLLRDPIASFHAHVERNPLLKRYSFNLCESSKRVKKAIRSQLETTYRILEAHPDLVVIENPVLVFHAGVARKDEDREKALARSRENVEYIAVTNLQLCKEYGLGRKVIPTIENGPSDGLALCQTVSEWRQSIAGLSDEVKLTLDYGHVLTVDGERGRLIEGLEDGKFGEDIVHLHLHHSPEVDREIRHAHAPFSMISMGQLQRLRDDLHRILGSTGIRKQGCITLEVPSKEPLDYFPWLRRMKRGRSMTRKLLSATGFYECDAQRGDLEDQLASLEIVREMVNADHPDMPPLS
jgi:sugar phosphate isomerase/epimerase